MCECEVYRVQHVQRSCGEREENVGRSGSHRVPRVWQRGPRVAQVMPPTLHCLVLRLEQWEGSEGMKPGRHVVRCAVLKTTHQNAVRGTDRPVAGATRKEGTVWLAALSFSSPLAC